MSAEPTIVIRFDEDRLDYRPGERLSGQYWITSIDGARIKAVEASVLWHTEGKGDEDLAVHAFWRRDADESEPIDPVRPERFATTLPNTPLSYTGQIIQLHWCVRVRVFLGRGKDIVGEKSFRLGEVVRWPS